MIISSERFYSVTVTDDDLLEVSEALESVHEGLGEWFLSHDIEFQRDLLSIGLLFWQDKGEIPGEGPAN